MSGVGWPPDDLSIPDDAWLLRRVNPRWFVADTTNGGLRLASGAFQDLTGRDGTRAMSVLVEQNVRELGKSPEDTLTGYEGWGLIAVLAGLVRQCGLTISWAPDPREGAFADAHAHVFGAKTGSVQKKLVAGSERRVWPVT